MVNFGVVSPHGTKNKREMGRKCISKNDDTSSTCSHKINLINLCSPGGYHYSILRTYGELQVVCDRAADHSGSPRERPKIGWCARTTWCKKCGDRNKNRMSSSKHLQY